MANEEEIKSIVKLIEENPERWGQDDWVGDPFGELDTGIEITIPRPQWSPVDGHIEAVPMPVQAVGEECGTRCCVAGHAIMRAGYLVYGAEVFTREGVKVGFIADVGRDLLGLTEAQSKRIFKGSNGSRGGVQALKNVITRTTGITFD